MGAYVKDGIAAAILFSYCAIGSVEESPLSLIKQSGQIAEERW
jgi:hypothetical protein